jgi:hypothetical protein
MGKARGKQRAGEGQLRFAVGQCPNPPMVGRDRRGCALAAAGPAVVLQTVFTPRSRRAVGVSVLKGLASPRLRMARQKQSRFGNIVGGVPSPRTEIYRGVRAPRLHLCVPLRPWCKKRFRKTSARPAVAPYPHCTAQRAARSTCRLAIEMPLSSAPMTPTKP